MTIDRAALIDAISDPLSLAHGAHAAKILALLSKSDTVSLLDAGRVFCAVLAELPEDQALAALDRMTLQGAAVQLQGQGAYLDAETVLIHPAFRDWVGRTAGDQAAVAINSGATLSGLAAAAPVFGGIAAVQVGTALHSILVDLHFPLSGGVATLEFGNRSEESHHCVRREASGAVLVGIGLALRDSHGLCAEASQIAPAATSDDAGETMH